MANDKDSDPFADYVWMGEMEKFDREMEAQMEEEFEEEEFIRSCIDQLLDEEEERETIFFQPQEKSNGQNSRRSPDPHKIMNMNGMDPNHLTGNMTNMYISQPSHQLHQPPFGGYSHQNGSSPQYSHQQPSQQQWSHTGHSNPLPYSPNMAAQHQKSQVHNFVIFGPALPSYLTIFVKSDRLTQDLILPTIRLLIQE